MNQIETPIGMPFTLTAAGQKAHDSLAKEIGSHNEQVSRLTESIEQLRREAETNVGGNYETAASKLRAKRAELLHNELGIRAKITDWLEVAGTTELWAYDNEAITDQETAEKKVTEQLIAIGFENDEYNRRIPAIVAQHPTVKEAWLRHALVSGTSPHRPFLDMNAQAIAKAQSELDELKTRATELLGV